MNFDALKKTLFKEAKESIPIRLNPEDSLLDDYNVCYTSIVNEEFKTEVLNAFKSFAKQDIEDNVLNIVTTYGYITDIDNKFDNQIIEIYISELQAFIVDQLGDITKNMSTINQLKAQNQIKVIVNEVIEEKQKTIEDPKDYVTFVNKLKLEKTYNKQVQGFIKTCFDKGNYDLLSEYIKYGTTSDKIKELYEQMFVEELNKQYVDIKLPNENFINVYTENYKENYSEEFIKYIFVCVSKDDSYYKYIQIHGDNDLIKILNLYNSDINSHQQLIDVVNQIKEIELEGETLIAAKGQFIEKLSTTKQLDDLCKQKNGYINQLLDEVYSLRIENFQNFNEIEAMINEYNKSLNKIINDEEIKKQYELLYKATIQRGIKDISELQKEFNKYKTDHLLSVYNKNKNSLKNFHSYVQDYISEINDDDVLDDLMMIEEHHKQQKTASELSVELEKNKKLFENISKCKISDEFVTINKFKTEINKKIESQIKQLTIDIKEAKEKEVEKKTFLSTIKKHTDFIKKCFNENNVLEQIKEIKKEYISITNQIPVNFEKNRTYFGWLEDIFKNVYKKIGTEDFINYFNFVELFSKIVKINKLEVKADLNDIFKTYVNLKEIQKKLIQITFMTNELTRNSLEYITKNKGVKVDSFNSESIRKEINNLINKRKFVDDFMKTYYENKENFRKNVSKKEILLKEEEYKFDNKIYNNVKTEIELQFKQLSENIDSCLLEFANVNETCQDLDKLGNEERCELSIKVGNLIDNTTKTIEKLKIIEFKEFIEELGNNKQKLEEIYPKLDVIKHLLKELPEQINLYKLSIEEIVRSQNKDMNFVTKNKGINNLEYNEIHKLSEQQHNEYKEDLLDKFKEQRQEIDSIIEQYEKNVVYYSIEKQEEYKSKFNQELQIINEFENKFNEYEYKTYSDKFDAMKDLVDKFKETIDTTAIQYKTQDEIKIYFNKLELVEKQLNETDFEDVIFTCFEIDKKNMLNNIKENKFEIECLECCRTEIKKYVGNEIEYISKNISTIENIEYNHDKLSKDVCKIILLQKIIDKKYDLSKIEKIKDVQNNFVERFDEGELEELEKEIGITEGINYDNLMKIFDKYKFSTKQIKMILHSDYNFIIDNILTFELKTKMSYNQISILIDLIHDSEIIKFICQNEEITKRIERIEEIKKINDTNVFILIESYVVILKLLKDYFGVADDKKMINNIIGLLANFDNECQNFIEDDSILDTKKKFVSKIKLYFPSYTNDLYASFVDKHTKIKKHQEIIPELYKKIKGFNEDLKTILSEGITKEKNVFNDLFKRISEVNSIEETQILIQIKQEIDLLLSIQKFNTTIQEIENNLILKFLNDYKNKSESLINKEYVKQIVSNINNCYNKENEQIKLPDNIMNLLKEDMTDINLYNDMLYYDYIMRTWFWQVKTNTSGIKMSVMIIEKLKLYYLTFIEYIKTINFNFPEFPLHIIFVFKNYILKYIKEAPIVGTFIGIFSNQKFIPIDIPKQTIEENIEFYKKCLENKNEAYRSFMNLKVLRYQLLEGHPLKKETSLEKEKIYDNWHKYTFGLDEQEKIKDTKEGKEEEEIKYTKEEKKEEENANKLFEEVNLSHNDRKEIEQLIHIYFDDYRNIFKTIAKFDDYFCKKETYYKKVNEQTDKAKDAYYKDYDVSKSGVPNSNDESKINKLKEFFKNKDEIIKNILEHVKFQKNTYKTEIYQSIFHNGFANIRSLFDKKGEINADLFDEKISYKNEYVNEVKFDLLMKAIGIDLNKNKEYNSIISGMIEDIYKEMSDDNAFHQFNERYGEIKKKILIDKLDFNTETKITTSSKFINIIYEIITSNLDTQINGKIKDYINSNLIEGGLDKEIELELRRETYNKLQYEKLIDEIPNLMKALKMKFEFNNTIASIFNKIIKSSIGHNILFKIIPNTIEERIKVDKELIETKAEKETDAEKAVFLNELSNQHKNFYKSSEVIRTWRNYLNDKKDYFKQIEYNCEGKSGIIKVCVKKFEFIRNIIYEISKLIIKSLIDVEYADQKEKCSTCLIYRYKYNGSDKSITIANKDYREKLWDIVLNRDDRIKKKVNQYIEENFQQYIELTKTINKLNIRNYKEIYYDYDKIIEEIEEKILKEDFKLLHFIPNVITDMCKEIYSNFDYKLNDLELVQCYQRCITSQTSIYTLFKHYSPYIKNVDFNKINAVLNNEPDYKQMRIKLFTELVPEINNSNINKAILELAFDNEYVFKTSTLKNSDETIYPNPTNLIFNKKTLWDYPIDLKYESHVYFVIVYYKLFKISVTKQAENFLDNYKQYLIADGNEYDVAANFIEKITKDVVIDDKSTLLSFDKSCRYQYKYAFNLIPTLITNITEKYKHIQALIDTKHFTIINFESNTKLNTIISFFKIILDVYKKFFTNDMKIYTVKVKTDYNEKIVLNYDEQYKIGFYIQNYIENYNLILSCVKQEIKANFIDDTKLLNVSYINSYNQEKRKGFINYIKTLIEIAKEFEKSLTLEENEIVSKLITINKTINKKKDEEKKKDEDIDYKLYLEFLPNYTIRPIYEINSGEEKLICENSKKNKITTSIILNINKMICDNLCSYFKENYLNKMETFEQNLINLLINDSCKYNNILNQTKIIIDHYNNIFNDSNVCDMIKEFYKFINSSSVFDNYLKKSYSVCALAMIVDGIINNLKIKQNPEDCCTNITNAIAQNIAFILDENIKTNLLNEANIKAIVEKNNGKTNSLSLLFKDPEKQLKGGKLNNNIITIISIIVLIIVIVIVVVIVIKYIKKKKELSKEVS